MAKAATGSFIEKQRGFAAATRNTGPVNFMTVRSSKLRRNHAMLGEYPNRAAAVSPPHPKFPSRARTPVSCASRSGWRATRFVCKVPEPGRAWSAIWRRVTLGSCLLIYRHGFTDDFIPEILAQPSLGGFYLGDFGGGDSVEAEKAATVSLEMIFVFSPAFCVNSEV